MIDPFEVFRPAGLAIDTPGPTNVESTYFCLMTTFLYRHDACLREAVDLVLARNTRESGLKVISAACSTGAEADTLLTLFERAGRNNIHMTGYDINELPVQIARLGRHAVMLEDSQQQRRPEIETALMDLGFDPGHVEDGRFTLDSNRLRSRHSVDFEVKDLTEEIDAEGVDLVVASNVLFHLEKSVRGGVIKNLAKTLGDGGVFDVGILSGHVLGKASNYSSVTAMLGRDFDLKPQVVGSSGYPRILAKA